MIVTQMEPFDKSRTGVYLDGEFAFVLYKGELRRFQIKEGGELSVEGYEQIMREILPKRCKLRAMNLLQKKFYSVADLRRKLQDGKYPAAIIDEALKYVASYGYTNDLRLAEDYIRCHRNGKSKRRIDRDLMQKGITDADIRLAWIHCEELGFDVDEQEQIRLLLEKKRFGEMAGDYKAQQKIYAFLLRRGYANEAVSRAMRAYGREFMPED